MTFLERLKNGTVYLDGGMGTLLQSYGLQSGELPERWNVTHPEIITKIHRDYLMAGADVLCANTFGANTLKFSDDELDRIVGAAFDNARRAIAESNTGRDCFIALDIGPSGKLLRPLGDLGFEEAVRMFASCVRLGVKHGASLILIETMSDAYETKAALLAAKENSDLPVIVTNAYDSTGKLMTGATPAAMVALLEGMGADAIGANCSLGPEQIKSVCEQLCSYSSLPVVMKLNAGLPRIEDGRTVYDVGADEFAEAMASLIPLGVRAVGGCCGTTPEYIRALRRRTENITPPTVTKKNVTLVSSYTHAVRIGSVPILVGERINPTGKPRLKQALISKDYTYVLSEGISQQDAGADMLDVNVGIPQVDEAALLPDVVEQLQAVTDLPLQLDSSDFTAIERAMRICNGKPMINSVNGSAESMRRIFPLVKKYGGVVVALTLDENGIAPDVNGRLEIAKRIISVAEQYGIDKKDIVFDPLAMAVSADSSSAETVIATLKALRDTLGVNTILGVSNVSFGLPQRDTLNATFFAMALGAGLSMAILNPHSEKMMSTYYSYLALSGLDAGFEKYIAASSHTTQEAAPAADAQRTLRNAIVSGMRELAAELTAQMLTEQDKIEIINRHVIPALDEVGRAYEMKRAYLPNLLMSAEAANAAFEKIKASSVSADKKTSAPAIVLATVKGDIHDIGKNIVRMLLENYGFTVIDLGRDVPRERVLSAVVENGARLVGLSALMTTTVGAMKDTIELIKLHAPDCKVVVGGAVLNEEYAMSIGADKYAADAMQTVRYASEVLS